MTDKAEDEIAGYYLTAQGAPVFGIAGPLTTQPTSAARFDGVDDAFADAPAGRVYFTGTADFTMVALAKLDQARGGDFGVVCFCGDTVNPNAGFGMGVHGTYTGNGLVFGMNYENIISVSSGSYVTAGAWHLLMGGRDSGGDTYMWIDGVQTAASPVSTSAPQAPTDSFLIGAQYWLGMIRCWDGDIAEVAFFDRILTDDDAEALQLARDPADWEFGGAVGAMPVWRWEAAEHGDAVTWARIVSPTHTADAVNAAATARLGPRQRVQPVVDADSDVKAGDYAASVLAAYAEAAPARHGRVFAPWHPGVELGDVVRVDVTGDGVDAALFRVAALTLEYTRRGDSPTPYSMTLDLGAL